MKHIVDKYPTIWIKKNYKNVKYLTDHIIRLQVCNQIHSLVCLSSAGRRSSF
jgi:hypothetical protein